MTKSNVLQIHDLYIYKAKHEFILDLFTILYNPFPFCTTPIYIRLCACKNHILLQPMILVLKKKMPKEPLHGTRSDKGISNEKCGLP